MAARCFISLERLTAKPPARSECAPSQAFNHSMAEKNGVLFFCAVTHLSGRMRVTVKKS
jgi:hypothetical protein